MTFNLTLRCGRANQKKFLQSTSNMLSVIFMSISTCICVSESFRSAVWKYSA